MNARKSLHTGIVMIFPFFYFLFGLCHGFTFELAERQFYLLLDNTTMDVDPSSGEIITLHKVDGKLSCSARCGNPATCRGFEWVTAPDGDGMYQCTTYEFVTHGRVRYK